jgi:hypothetical protein
MYPSHSFVHLTCVILSLSSISNAYYLSQTYNAANFFEEFTFFTATDPTEGYVAYEPLAEAEAAGFVYTSDNQVYLGVDHTTVNPSNGRESVRLTSNQAWGQGTPRTPSHTDVY